MRRRRKLASVGSHGRVKQYFTSFRRFWCGGSSQSFDNYEHSRLTLVVLPKNKYQIPNNQSFSRLGASEDGVQWLFHLGNLKIWESLRLCCVSTFGSSSKINGIPSPKADDTAFRCMKSYWQKTSSTGLLLLTQVPKNCLRMYTSDWSSIC